MEMNRSAMLTVSANNLIDINISLLSASHIHVTSNRVFHIGRRSCGRTLMFKPANTQDRHWVLSWFIPIHPSILTTYPRKMLINVIFPSSPSWDFSAKTLCAFSFPDTESKFTEIYSLDFIHRLYVL
jgi:hypothetical protein